MGLNPDPNIVQAPNFRGLPAELRSRIWKFFLGLDEYPHVIELTVTMQASLFRRTSGELDVRNPVQHHWQLSCFSQPDPRLYLGISQEVNSEIESIVRLARLRETHFLEFPFGRGRRIYYTPGRDTMFLDLQSLYNIGQYWSPSPISQFMGYGLVTRQMLMYGFDNVQRLAIPCALARFNGMDNIVRRNGFTGVDANAVVLVQPLPQAAIVTVDELVQVLRDELERLADGIPTNGTYIERRVLALISIQIGQMARNVHAFFER